MTTTYRVRGPDGQVHEFSGPDNATPDAVLAAATAQFGTQQPQGSPADRARAAGQQQGSTFSAPISGLYSAANSALLGGGDYVAAATRYLAQHGGAAAHPDDFSTDLAYSQGISSGARDAHPVASIAGDVGGALAPGAGLAHGVETATRLGPKLALQAHEPIANLLRLIGSGALAGGSYGAARGGVEGGEQNGAAGVLPGAGLGGATGVVTGAVAAPLGAGVAKVAQKTVQSFAPQAQKAIALLADKLGTSPDTIATAMTDYKSSTGHAPTIADIADAVTKANVEPVVNARQSSAAKMQTAAQAKAAALPAQMSQGITSGGATKTPFNGAQVSTARVADLRNTQSGLMDVAMGPRGADGARHPAALGAQPVLDAQTAGNFLQQPQVVEARQSIPGLDSILKRGLIKNVDISNPGANDLSVDDIDSVRQSLSRLQQTVGATNSHFADDIGQIRDTLVGQAKQAQPAYGQALDAYTRQEQFIQGFQHAAQGKSIHDVPDMGDIRTFDTHEGRAGLELGARSRLAQTAGETESGAARTAQQLRQGAPSKTLESLPTGEQAALQSRGAATAKSQQNYADLAANSLPSKAQETANGIQNAVEGTVATVGHTLTGFKAHAVTRLLTKAGTSEATANGIVDLLTRANTPQDIANLKNALNRSVSDARIRRLVLKQVGRNAAVGTTSALQGAVK